MRVGMTGTRKGATPQQLAKARQLLLEWGATHLSHGAAKGADTQLHELAGDLGLIRRVWPADNVPSNLNNLSMKKSDALFGGGPALERNKSIVNDVTRMMGFPGGNSEELRSGTWAAIRYARRVKREMHIIWPDGTVTVENSST